MKVSRHVALASMSLSVVFGFARVFTGWTFLIPLGIATIMAHLCASASRSLPRGLATLAMCVAGWIVCVGSALPSTFALPTGSTLQHLRGAIHDAQVVLAHGTAPTPTNAGLILISCIALWCAAWSADRLNFHYHTHTEAIAPSTTIFLVVTLLAGPRVRWVSAGLFALSVCTHFLVGRAARHGASATERRRLVMSGGAMCLVAVLGGLGAAAQVPALHNEGLIAIRSNVRDGPPRSVVSPLVDIRSRLVNQSNQELFRVTSDHPMYWRLMTLDTFDGVVWSSNQRYRKTGVDLDNGDVDVATNSSRVRARYRIDKLDGPWAPAAYRPISLHGTHELLWDEAGSTLIVKASRGSVHGLSYQVTSEVPKTNVQSVRRATSTAPQRSDLSLPKDFPHDLVQLAHQITDHAKSPYDKALALQNYFRNNPHFVYTTSVPPGESTDAIRSFLLSGKGFCEQFAGTYAALARAVGLPTRLAVGFTSGNQVGDQFTVFGHNAHAWPEVYFDELGWLAFEPTPGRSNPTASTYTGIRPNEHPSSQAATTTTQPTTSSPSSTVPPAPSTSSAPLPTIAPKPPTPAGAATSKPLPWRWVGLSLCFVIALMLLPVARVLRQHARRSRSTTPAQRILLCWHEVIDAFRCIELRRLPSETDRDFGNRLVQRLENLPGTESGIRPATHLASLATIAAWGPTTLSDNDVAVAQQNAQMLCAIARTQRTWWSTVRRWFTVL